MDWGRSEHDRIPERVYPLFADFLRKCYTVKECHSRSLNSDISGTTLGGSSSAPPPPPHDPVPPQPHPHVPQLQTNQGLSAEGAPSMPENLDLSSTRQRSHNRSASPPQPNSLPLPPTLTLGRKRPNRSRSGDVIDGGRSKRVKVTEGEGGLLQTRSTQRTAVGSTSTPAAQPSATDSSDVGTVWFEEALLLFAEGGSAFGENGKGNLGPLWLDCVDAYASFQRKSGFGQDKRLPTKGRPDVVKEWVGVGRTRSKNWRPRFLEPEKFEKVFDTWWTGLQPEWRVEGGKVVTKKVIGDWGCLVYPGPNGLLSVMGCLFFWGLEAYGKKARWKKWELAVIDCTTALQHL
ncbi:hypothetical protein CVT24_012584 [Panaeolus cyanescens]|uniref:Uncharacterized protein n=1 Tax=Panaeolus cyanescens TaxID=181874 RepID=A0A409YK14_9AGAR|nr:hypothetical protein CVT24_012584 [Panaeolus cyanescens]